MKDEHYALIEAAGYALCILVCGWLLAKIIMQ